MLFPLLTPAPSLSLFLCASHVHSPPATSLSFFYRNFVGAKASHAPFAISEYQSVRKSIERTFVHSVHSAVACVHIYTSQENGKIVLLAVSALLNGKIAKGLRPRKRPSIAVRFSCGSSIFFRTLRNRDIDTRCASEIHLIKVYAFPARARARAATSLAMKNSPRHQPGDYEIRVIPGKIGTRPRRISPSFFSSKIPIKPAGYLRLNFSRVLKKR